MKIEWVEECKSCKGTGLYQGIGECNGAAVVCEDCEGSGKFYTQHEYKEFTGRVKVLGVSRVYKTGAGIVLNPEMTPGGVPLEEWERNPDAVTKRGAELREQTCPAWWY